MSQSSFLESVVTWNENQCKSSLKEALPKLICHFQESEVLQEELGILKIICLSFLPLVPVADAEEMVFSPVTSKTYGMLDQMLLSLQENATQASMVSELQQLLQLLAELVDCYTLCIKHVNEQGRQSTVDLSLIHSLPYGAIHLLKGTYGHCKSSSAVYGDVLPSVADLLSQLFRRAHALHVAFLSLLETVSVDESASSQQVEDLCQICEGLFDVCQLVTSLDIKLVCSLWKSISRLCGRHRSLLASNINMDAMVTHLCSEVSSSYIYMFQLAGPPGDPQEVSLSQGDSAALERSLRVVNYELRILVTLLDNYITSISTCIPDLLQMLICINSKLSPCLSAPVVNEQQTANIRQQVQYAVEPIINILVTNRTFIQLVLSDSNDHQHQQDPCAYLQILVKIMNSILRQTAEIVDLWLNPAAEDHNPEQGLLHLVFQTVSKCYVELSVPVMMKGTSGPPAGDQSLYEYTCTHMCGFLAALPAKHFSQMEECLLTYVLSYNLFTSCLASDVWCFLARYGSAELCLQQTCNLIDLSRSLQELHGCSAPCRNIQRLLARLVKFLAPEQQVKLLKQYSMETNLDLWSDVTLAVFPQEKRQDLAHRLYAHSLAQIQQFLQFENKLYTHLTSVVSALRCVSSLLTHQITGQYSLPDTGPLVDIVTQVWTVLDTGEWMSDPLLATVFTNMVTLFTTTSRHLNNSYILKILNASRKIHQTPVYLKLRVAKLLLHCGSKTLPMDAEQPQVMSRLPSIFSSLLTDSHSLVHHVAMETFTQFAESTPYEEMVPQCLAGSEKLQDAVVAFLNKTPHGCADFDMLDHLRLQLTTVTGHQSSTEQLEAEPIDLEAGNQAGDMLDEIRATEQPITKRKRVEENQDEVDVQVVFSCLDRGMIQLETLCNQETFPSSRKEELLSIYTRLGKIIDQVQKPSWDKT